MKFLKTYKIFEENDDVVNVIQDLLTELSDDDIVVEVTNLNNSGEKISILIGDDNEEDEYMVHPIEFGGLSANAGKIDISKYIETLELVDKYLTDEGYVIEFGHFLNTDNNGNESSFFKNNFIEIKEKLQYTHRLKICEIVYKKLELKETIKVPIEIGDTVLGGRFKNKKVVVKKIGKNKKGDITINDKPLLKYRIVKESLQEDADYYFKHLEDDGFFIECKEDHIRICRPSELDDRGSYKISSLQKFEWNEIVSEVSRYVSEIDDTDKSISYMYVIKPEQGQYMRKGLLKGIVLDETFDAGEITCFVIGFK